MWGKKGSASLEVGNNKRALTTESTFFDHVMTRLLRMRGRQKQRNNVRASIEFMERIRRRGDTNKPPSEHTQRWKPGTTFDARPHLAGMTDIARIEKDALYSPTERRISAAPDPRPNITPQFPSPVEPKQIAAFAFPSPRSPIDLNQVGHDDSVVLVACNVINDIQNMLVR